MSLMCKFEYAIYLILKYPRSATDNVNQTYASLGANPKIWLCEYKKVWTLSASFLFVWSMQKCDAPTKHAKRRDGKFLVYAKI